MHVIGNFLQAFWPMVDGVHGSDIRQECLRGTNIGGSALTADVLLAGLQSQAVSRAAFSVHGYAHQTARHLPLELVSHRHESCVWATEKEGNTKALRGTNNDIGAKGTRTFQEQQGQQISRDGNKSAAAVDFFNNCPWVKNIALGTGVRNHRADEVFAYDSGAEICNFDFEINCPCALCRHGEYLRVQAGVQQDAAALLDSTRHQADCLSNC